MDLSRISELVRLNELEKCKYIEVVDDIISTYKAVFGEVPELAHQQMFILSTDERVDISNQIGKTNGASITSDGIKWISNIIESATKKLGYLSSVKLEDDILVASLRFLVSSRKESLEERELDLQEKIAWFNSNGIEMVNGHSVIRVASKSLQKISEILTQIFDTDDFSFEIADGCIVRAQINLLPSRLNALKLKLAPNVNANKDVPASKTLTANELAKLKSLVRDLKFSMESVASIDLPLINACIKGYIYNMCEILGISNEFTVAYLAPFLETRAKNQRMANESMIRGEAFDWGNVFSCRNFGKRIMGMSAMLASKVTVSIHNTIEASLRCNINNRYLYPDTETLSELFDIIEFNDELKLLNTPRNFETLTKIFKTEFPSSKIKGWGISNIDAEIIETIDLVIYNIVDAIERKD